MRALLSAIVEREHRQEKAAARRAALVASAIYNVNRAKGKKMITPDDFFKPEVKQVSGRELAEALRTFAKVHNQKLARRQGAEHSS